MPHVLKRRRVHNPGFGKKRKRKMTAKQIMHFGTKRQRAALKRKRRNPGLGKYERMRASARKKGHVLKMSAQEKYKSRSEATRYAKRQGNIGEILTIGLPGLNPGRTKKGAKSNMARHRRKNRATAHRRVVRRRHNPIMRARRRTYRRSNPKVVVRYRNRRSVGRRHYSRRRNPGFGGAFGTVAGLIGGATVTSLVSGMLPASLNTGMVGYLSSAVVAMLQGKMLGKLFKSPALGNNMTYGGYTFVALKILQDYVPNLYSSLGLKGMGILTPSSFYVPQVNQPGSMASFVTPSAVTAAIPAATGMGRLGNVLNTRRVGRMA